MLYRDILTSLGLNLKKSKHVIKGGEGHLKVSIFPIIDLATCKFKYSNMGKITPQVYFVNAYLEK